MTSPICAVTGCGNRDNTGRCTAAIGVFGERPLACAYGKFATAVESELGDLGEWRLRQYADGPAKATLRGRLGAVEVWGARHANEVWFIQRGTKAETPLCERWAVADGTCATPWSAAARWLACRRGWRCSATVFTHDTHRMPV